MTNLKPIPIGIDNFKELVNKGYYYVDKTDLIEEILTRGAKVNLFPRPRRFGKTLTISMLENYFNIKKKEENENLFCDLKINNAQQGIREKQGKYPVISLNLKGVKDDTWKKELNKLKAIISRLYQDNEEVKSLLSLKDQEYYNKIINETALEEEYQLSLKNLSIFLANYYKQPTIILIDEYDAPIENGFLNGFYDNAINFMRNFFGEALKTNEYLNFACMTGILRVSKESIFSGLNNLKIYSILDSQYSEYFGFVPKEVDKILEDYNIENKEDIKKWYDGYNFGGTEIYNPWSILNSVDDRKIQPYWINTGGTSLLENMLKTSASDIKQELEQLLLGECIAVKLNENVVYSEITGSRENIYNFMLLCGYLTVERVEMQGKYQVGYLRIPNLEVEIAFENMIERWFQYSTGREEINTLQKALLVNEREVAEEALNNLMLKCMSFFDNAENFYHGFVLGLMVDMGNEYIVKSNRESGFGKYDMKIEKKDGTLGIIIEFKTAKKDSEDKMENMAKEALEQIEKNKYYLDMQERGIKNILMYGVAFNNKKAVLR